MAVSSAIEVDASFAKVVKRYAQAADKTAIVLRGLQHWAQAEGVAEARRQLDTLVYDAPVSKSGYKRTERTRKAVKTRGDNEIIVDMSAAVNPRSGFYYPPVLNRGRTDISYEPRPFWNNTKLVMATRFKMQGEESLRTLRVALKVE